MIDEEDRKKVEKYRWHVNSGYLRGWVGNKKMRLQNYIISPPDGYYVDHINGNPLDNRKENLRIVSKIENSRNRKLNHNNTSGYRGVYYDKRSDNWVARINYFKKKLHLGSFNNKKDAACAYNRAAIKYYGSFAQFNKV